MRIFASATVSPYCAKKGLPGIGIRVSSEVDPAALCAEGGTMFWLLVLGIAGSILYFWIEERDKKRREEADRRIAESAAENAGQPIHIQPDR